MTTAEPFSEMVFVRLSDLIRRRSGMVLEGDKQALLANRVRERMEILGLLDPADYLDRLWFSEEAGEELRELTDSVLINETLFYRDEAQMKLLEETIFPAFLRRAAADSRSERMLRVWSAGCSTGAEAYSLVMAFEEARLSPVLRETELSLEVLGTDISSRALAEAVEARYRNRPVMNAPERIRERYFERLAKPDEKNRNFRVADEIRSSCRFRRLNLIMDAYPQELDLILCRNVLIYFDGAMRQRAIEGFYRALKPDGCLFVGHSESLLDWPELFQPRFEGETCYYRKWSTSRRNFVRAGREDKTQRARRRPPEFQPPPVFRFEERKIIRNGRDEPCKIFVAEGVLDRNADKRKLKEDLLLFLGAEDRVKVVDLSRCVFVANEILRTLRQALAAAAAVKTDIAVVAKQDTLEHLRTARFDDFALLWDADEWSRRETESRNQARSVKPDRRASKSGKRSLAPAAAPLPDRRVAPGQERPSVAAVDRLSRDATHRVPPASQDARERRATDRNLSSPAISVCIASGTARLVVSGRLDSARFPDLLGRIKENIATLVTEAAARGGTESLIVELRDVVFIDEEVIRVLKRAATLATHHGLFYEITAAEERVRRYLERQGSKA